ncbi:MAG: UDP-N-acetylglucosamine 2-epimerase [Myxococcales bacterium]|nr:UDP-N-acetylglucosamine 2-epimerase [Myxococcales bacterium]
MKRTKILVVYENGAGGHRSLALAIDEALKELADIDSSVLEIDSLAPSARKKMYSAFMDFRHYVRPLARFGFKTFALSPNPVFALYRHLGSILQPLGVRRLLDFLHREQPDLIVSTHFRPNVALNAWRERGRLRTPVYAAIADYVAHGVYAQPAIGQYYVATDAVRDDLLRHGVPRERIHTTGIPVSLTLLQSDSRSQSQLRHDLGLIPEAQTILLMGGARGDVDYATLLQALAVRKANVQVVVICGWNKALRARIQELANTLPFPVHVKGFERNMAIWYRAVDLVMTKPGGMTTTEVLVMEKPMILLAPAPGKEEVQAERLTAAGVALYERDPHLAIEAALRVMSDEAQKQRMTAATQALRRPDAAREVAALLAQAARNSAASLSSHTSRP